MALDLGQRKREFDEEEERQTDLKRETLARVQ